MTAAILLSACGTQDSGSVDVPAAEPLPQLETVPLESVREELLLQRAPEGVDPQLYGTLQRSLLSALEASGQERFSSAAPDSSLSAVDDLNVTDNGDGTATLNWTYRNQGDGDLNSEVNIADLTPIGIHLGKSDSGSGWEAAQATDNDRNGEVNISDVTPIGSNFLRRVDGYRIQRSADGNEPWENVQDVLFAQSAIGAGMQRGFSLQLDSSGGMHYRVLPYDAGGEGIAGNVAMHPWPGFSTSGPLQAVAMPDSGLALQALLTVGDEVPLLVGTWPDLTPDPALTFALTGKPDGLGQFEANGYHWLWVNHEIRRGTSTDFSKTIGGQIEGARVSLFMFNQDWQCLGGMNLVSNIMDGGTELGSVKIDSGSVVQSGYIFSLFCSAQLTTLFDDGLPLFLPGEEEDDGFAWAMHTDGHAERIENAQSMARETNIPLSIYPDTTALIGLEDRTGRPIVLYVDARDGADPDGFSGGASYVLNIEDGDGNFLQNSDGMNPAEAYKATWAAIPLEHYADAAAYHAWSEGGDERGTDFLRTEDGNIDPMNPSHIYFVSTGGNGSYDVYGSLFRLEMNPADPLGEATLTMVTQGGPGSFISPDNVTIDSQGMLYIMEDANTGAPKTQIATENRNCGIWRMALDGSGQQLVIQQDQTPYDGVNTMQELLDGGINIWETSGIIPVPTMAGEGLLFAVQADSVTSTADMNGGNYLNGGQLVLALPVQ
ncbi:hypothetical protein KDL29_06800 [bacterium]|nr:hypothetical protein [bacterium]